MSSFLFFCSVLLVATASHGIKPPRVRKDRVKISLSHTGFILQPAPVGVPQPELVYIYEGTYATAYDCASAPAVEPNTVNYVPWCFPVEDDDARKVEGYLYYGIFTDPGTVSESGQISLLPGGGVTVSAPDQLSIQTIYFKGSSTCDLMMNDGILLVPGNYYSFLLGDIH